MEQISKEERVSKIWEEFRDGKNYQKSMGLESMLPLCVDFFEGRHWGKINDKTKTLPRPIFNQVEMITQNKVAGILSTPLKIVFNSSSVSNLSSKLTAFNSHIEKEMGLDEICEELVTAGAIEGASFVHVYWDADAIGKRGEYKGGVRLELLEPLNVVVHNPRETDIQKQKFVIIESRCELDAVKSMCYLDLDKEHIVSDNNENIRDSEREQDGSEMVTVLTKYFRVDNEVYFERVTKDILLTPPTPLNPDAIKNKDLKIDGAKLNLTDEIWKKESPSQFKATLYPIEVYQYKKRKNCIYGRGEVEPIIPNNRTINFNTAMMSKGVEDQGFGQVVVKDGAMGKGDKFTNDPTRILIDRYKGGQGFYTLSKQPFNPLTYQLNKEIMETTRVVTGSTQVMSGEFMGANQSGTSIAYLQQQAQKPIDKLAKNYRKFRRKLAEVLFQFYVLFYEDKEFYNENIENSNFQISGLNNAESINNMSQTNDNMLNNSNILTKSNDINQDFNNLKNVKFKDVFNGSEVSNIDFDITIEVGAGTQFSEILIVNMLENLFRGGKINLKTYYKIYPDNLLPNKKELLKEIEDESNLQIANLNAVILNQKNEIEVYKKNIESLSKIVNNIASTINENKKLKELLAELQAEYFNKIKLANETISNIKSDATSLADYVVNNEDKFNSSKESISQKEIESYLNSKEQYNDFLDSEFSENS